MTRFLRENGLSIVMFTIFAICLLGQSAAGWKQYQDEQQDHGQPSVSYGEYLTTGHFWEATFENWESEFLQMAGYVFLTVFLFQKGSAESKDPDQIEPVDEDPALHRDDPDAPFPVRRGGLLLTLYSYSLTIAFAFLFMGAFLGQLWGGHAEYNHEQLAHGKPTIPVTDYLTSSTLWF